MGGVIKADRTACQGYANCVIAAEDYFDIDDRGLVVARKTVVPHGGQGPSRGGSTQLSRRRPARR